MSQALARCTVEEIRRIFLDDGAACPPDTLRRLRRDKRLGVRRIAENIDRRRRAVLREGRRIERLQRLESVLWRRGLRNVAGVDEAGTGPLAGPVVAAAVIFPPGIDIQRIDDSKRLDEDTRVELEALIRSRALAVGIGSADVAEIDRLNVYHAALLAMHRAVVSLGVKAEFVLSDARVVPDLAIGQRAIIRGDRKCFSVAAASILAKTHRDRLMQALDVRYPDYGFARHKGYPTAAHREAILRHGLSDMHRRSFPLVQELAGQWSESFYRLRAAIERSRSVLSANRVEERMRRDAARLALAERQRLKLLLDKRRSSLVRQQG